MLFVVAPPDMNADDGVAFGPAPGEKCINILLDWLCRLKELPDRLGVLVERRIIAVSPAVKKDNFFSPCDLPERVFAQDTNFVPNHAGSGNEVAQWSSFQEATAGPAAHCLKVSASGVRPCRQRHTRRRELTKQVPIGELKERRVLVKRRIENSAAIFFHKCNDMSKQKQAVGKLSGFIGDN